MQIASNQKIIAILIVAIFVVGFTGGYLLRTPEIQDLKNKMDQTESLLDSIEDVPFYIEINATSPHIANGSDFSKVTINVKNIYNESLPNQDVLVIMHGGEDLKTYYYAEDLGNGTYTALVNTTISGIYDLIAVVNGTGVGAYTTVEFLPGDVDKVEILDFTHPFEDTPKDVAIVEAAAVDKFGNIVRPPQSNITITTNIGEILNTTVDGDGIYTSIVFVNETGNYSITVRDKSGAETNMDFEVPRIYLSAPERIPVNNTFGVIISVFVPHNESPLGYFDFNVSFNTSCLEFIGGFDANPYDPIPMPESKVQPDGTIRIYKNLTESGIEKIGTIGLVNLTFYGLEPGNMSFSLQFTNNDPENFVDCSGKPYIPTPVKKSGKTEVTSKKVTLKLKIWKVEGQVTDSKIEKDLARLKEILKQMKRICGIDVVFDIEYNTISRNDWKKIDKDNDGRLDEFIDPDKPTDEEKALLNNHFIKGRINIYYIKEFDEDGKGSDSTGEFLEYGDKKSVVVDSDDSNKNTLAHEIGHYFGLGHVNDPKNLMYPRARPDKGKITKEQCQKMASSMLSETKLLRILLFYIFESLKI